MIGFKGFGPGLFVNNPGFQCEIGKIYKSPCHDNFYSSNYDSDFFFWKTLEEAFAYCDIYMPCRFFKIEVGKIIKMKEALCNK